MRTSLFFLFAFFLFANPHYTKPAFGDEDARTKTYWETFNKKNQEWLKRNKELPDDVREIDSICNDSSFVFGRNAPYKAKIETVCPDTPLKENIPRELFFRNLKGIALYVQEGHASKEYPINRDSLIRLFKRVIDKAIMPYVELGPDCKSPELDVIDAPPFTNNFAPGEKGQNADTLTIVVNLSFLNESKPEAAIITQGYYRRPLPECKALVPYRLNSFAVPLNLPASDIEKVILQNVHMSAQILTLKPESWSMLRYRCDKENARIELEKFHFWDGMREYNGVELQNPRDNDIQEQGKDIYYAERQEENTNFTPIHRLKSPLACEIAGQKISMRPAAEGAWYVEEEKNEKKFYAAVNVNGYWRPLKIGDTAANYLLQRNQPGQWEFCADRTEGKIIRKECEAFSLIEDNFTPPVVYPFRNKTNKQHPVSKSSHELPDCDRYQLRDVKFVDKSQLLSDTAFFDPSTLFSFLGDGNIGVKWCVKGALEGGNMCKTLSDKGYVKNYDLATRCAKSALGGKRKEQLALADFFFYADDFKNALKWYRTAAEKGSLEAWVKLGGMYSKSGGRYASKNASKKMRKDIPEDEAEALKWYRMAAEKGSEAAQREIGTIYLSRAEKNPKDYEEAAFWLNLHRGTFPTYLAWHLTAEQIAAVQERVKEWKENHKTDAKESSKTKKIRNFSFLARA